MKVAERFINNQQLILPWTLNMWGVSGSRLRSQNQGKHGTVSYAEFTYDFPSDGKISFNYTVSSEGNYDYIWFDYDGVRMVAVSGESGTRSVELDVSKGRHTFRWSYRKDGSTNKGNDEATIWNLVLEYVGVNLEAFKVSPSEIHKESIEVAASVVLANETELPFNYRLLVDNTQVYPDSGWTEDFIPPKSINHTIPADKFPINATSVVSIEMKDSNTDSRFYFANGEAKVTRNNKDPNANLYLSSSRVHKENAILSAIIEDPEKDTVRYRLFLNDKQILPETGWSPFALSPHSFSYSVRAVDLKIGENILRLDVEDDLGGTLTESLTLYKDNNLPEVLNPEVRGFTVYSTMDDKDKDLVQYRVLVDGDQVYPEQGQDWSKYLPVPINMSYQITDPTIQAGVPHLIRIEVRDELGEENYWEDNLVLDYPGLLFTDESGGYYSNHIGEILKLLDTGTTVAGNDSNVFKVLLRNNSGFALKDVKLMVVQRDLDPVDEVVQISKTESPFDPSQELKYDGRMKHGDIIPFYVRIHTTRKAIGGGQFDIYVSAHPTN
ncbi:hypothetical protein SP15_062 [Bacillus phage SP-15]|uniref:Uncharacterized protein n=1 Tax=Bacillus phage SP-15 TaxID=1792032 RepID=A0A127AYP7_9CAUD|nr:hypothetical protein SP15_062 [Bacillus phage SP-15]AMM44861.1 hypothetical protein SP15_062 [Bacillus phage SP-15]